MQKNKDYEDVLRSIYKAALETKSYLARIKKGVPADQDAEQRLSGLWVEAAVRLSRIDYDLSDKCLIKAYCWSDPRLWNDPKYSTIPLSIDTIFEEARALLKH